MFVPSTVGRILFIGQKERNIIEEVNECGFLSHLLISKKETNKKIDRRIAAGGQRFGKYVDS